MYVKDIHISPGMRFDYILRQTVRAALAGCIFAAGIQLQRTLGRQSL